MAKKPKRIKPRPGEVGRASMRPDKPRADMVPVNVETRGQSTSGAMVREAELSIRCHTARTVNDELRALEAQLHKTRKQLERKPDCPRLADIMRQYQDKLTACINAGLAGRTWRHRSQVEHANHGLRTNRNMAPMWSATNKG